ncbi:MAG: phosphoribosylanthranilate isomerase [Woeseiaceae bacterium]|nr:phosphoribosylanthranilate isomerase [Woeseiaceae bacterium]
MTPIVKICGLTDEQSLQAAIDAGADAVGFVFAESPRHIDVARALELSSRIPESTRKVAVMLHPSKKQWQEVLEGFGPDVLQTDLEDFDYLDVPANIERWPVIRQGEVPTRARLPETFVYEGRASGSGETVDWKTAAQLAGQGKMILAGGLDDGNVAEAIAAVSPFGVDVSSGVESAPGKKDVHKIRLFIQSVKGVATLTEGKKV